MKFEFHHHYHFHSDPALCDVAERLGEIERKLDAMHAETKQLVTELNEATNVLAAKIDKLITNAHGGLTKEQAVEHNAALTTLRDQLRAMGADQNDPLPEPLP